MRTRILHISDVHFGDRKHAFTRHGKTDPEALAKLLSKVERPKPDLVVMSGDIGWSGASADYDDAKIFCQRLKSISPASFVIIPGNHDVNRADGVPDDQRQEEFTKFVRDFYGSELNKHYPLLDRTDLPLSTRERLLYFSSTNELVVASMNTSAKIQGWTSCPECRRRKSDTSGDICKACGMKRPCRSTEISLNAAAAAQIEDLLEGKPEHALRVFVMHHNMFPFSEPALNGVIDSHEPGVSADMTTLANSAAFQGWLGRCRFHLVLHGHKHQPHGRQDTLFRRNDGPQGRRIVVLGAGSVGVVQKERGTEPPSFFIVDCKRLSNQRFSIRTAPMQIVADALTPYSTSDFGEFACEAGPAPSAQSQPLVFCAERMVDCHQAISDAFSSHPNTVFRNFISVVDSTEFGFPLTTLLEGSAVSEDIVRGSFLALHPEYDETDGWQTSEKAQARLRNVPPRFRFQHGPRMFGLSNSDSQIERVVKLLQGTANSSHAFVGVFQSHIDNTVRSGPPPALTGVQFSVDGDRLDVTFMFRKIDLSFWWVVNMLEAIRLWEWLTMDVAELKGKRGRVTFFATLAEWKNSGAGVALKTDIDEMPLEDIVEAVLAADHGDCGRILELLRQKRERTNENNIDAAGMGNLTNIVTGLLKVTKRNNGRWSQPVLQSLQDAHKALVEAEHDAKKDSTFRSSEVKADLKRALEAIQRVETALS